MMSVLKINLDKIALLELNREEEEVKGLAREICCGTGSWPIKYRVPSGGNHLKDSFWEPVFQDVQETSRLEESVYIKSGKINSSLDSDECVINVFYVFIRIPMG